MRVNGEAIYGTTRSVFQWGCYGLPTQKGRCVYLIQDKYLGPEFVLAGVGTPVSQVELLATQRRLTFRQEGSRLFVSGLPPSPPDPLCTVVKITFEGEPRWAAFPC
jgi:hypothetical protein